MSYFMGFIALVRCLLVLRCGLAAVVWYLDVGFSISLFNYQDDARSNKHKIEYNISPYPIRHNV